MQCGGTLLHLSRISIQLADGVVHYVFWALFFPIIEFVEPRSQRDFRDELVGLVLAFVVTGLSWVGIWFIVREVFRAL